MKRNNAKHILIAMGILTGILSVSLTASETPATAQVTTTEAPAAAAIVDKAAPEFTLTDINGKKHSLSEYKGKTVVLEWTNYDCPFVKKFYESGSMQKWQAAYVKKGVVWLSICSSAPEKQGNFAVEIIKERMTSAKASPTTYLLDTDGAVGKLYGAKTTPHMFVINAAGVLVYAGAIDDIKSTDAADIAKAKNYVAGALDAVMAGKAVEPKTTTPYGCSVKY